MSSRVGRGLPMALMRRTFGLLVGVFGFHLGYYLVLPFLAVLLTRRGLGAAGVGMALGMASIAFQVSSLVGGPLVDRVGRRLVMVAGLLVRGAGLLWLGYVSSGPLVALAAGISGVGAGLYAPALKVALAGTAGDETAEAFSLRGIFANLGTTLGPLLGGLLLGRGGGWLFALAALANGLTALWTAVTLPPEAAGARPQEGAHAGASVGERQEIELPTGRAALISLLGLSALLWALFAQLNLAVPLRAARILPVDREIGLLWTISSIAVILLQWPVTRVAARYLRTPARLAVGALLMGAGLGSAYLAGRFFTLVAALLLFTLGEMLAVPAADNAISLLAPPGRRGIFFGLSTFVWALGEGLGNFGGGLLLAYSRRAGLPALPWLLFAATGALIALGFWLLGRLQSARPPVRS